MTVVVDTSAVVAILRNEPEAPRFLHILLSTDVLISAATYVEAGIVTDRATSPAKAPVNPGDSFDLLLREVDAVVVDVTPTLARLARWAYRAYGKGSGHAASLNFGDCFSYALAIDRAAPLLFKGADFPHTDVAAAWSPTEP